MTLKSIALLELTGSGSTTVSKIRKTLFYYWTTSNLFNPMTIIDTTGSVNTTLELLEQYYNLGYRIFFGFNRSSMLNSVLPWFNSHKDAIGVSPSSSSDTLAIEKSIYRLQIVDSFLVKAMNPRILQSIGSGGRVFYFYSGDEIASENVLTILITIYGVNNIIPYKVNADSSNLTVNEVSNFFENNNVSANDIVMIYLFVTNQRQRYIDLFTTTNNLIIPSSQYDISIGGFPIINSLTTTLTNLYNVLALINITTSKIFNEGRNYLAENFNENILNSLYLINALENEENINELYSYSGTLEFDNVTKDIKYGSVDFLLYTNPNYNSTIIYTDDPFYGNITFARLPV